MSKAAPARQEHSVPLAALQLLINLGWHFLPTAEALAMRGNTREVILRQRLIEVLQTRRFDYKGEPYPLSPSGIDQIVRQVRAVSLADGLLPANERLYQMLTLGVTITEFMSDGRRHQATIALIDWHNVAANRWDVTQAMPVLSAHGTHERCPDLVAFVNGLPLVVIEAKRPEAEQPANAAQAMLDEGIQQQLRNQRPDEIPLLFAYAHLLLALNTSEGRYGTTLTAPTYWARWREQEFTEHQLRQWKNRGLPAAEQAALLASLPAALQAHCRSLWAHTAPPTDQDRLLCALLLPERLLELLRLFMLFDRKAGKVVARYQQFFGIRALLARVKQRKPDGAREGGVVWHTTGSGKSFSMVFLTKALVMQPHTRACRVVVVTDRLDLEAQLARNFMNSGAFGSAVASRKQGEKAKVSTGRELAHRIGKGSERIVFTLIHKFATAARLLECYNHSADVIVLVDEGHRSHGGAMHEHMRKALPRAAFVAFTGTPLLKKEKTANRFGPIVHAYTMQRAVEDGTVTPLLYEERVPELTLDEAAIERWFRRITAGLNAEQTAALVRGFKHQQAVHGASQRIALIAWDIAQHFSATIKLPGLGLKGQLATASKLDAIRYKQHLDNSGLVSSAIVMSAPDNREGIAELDEGLLPEVQRWWNQHVGRDADAYEQRVLQDFASEGGPDLLIVVDRLLTGFDEPRNTVLYIDKPLKEHNLIQAVARVNRLHEAKRYGVLVDYRGILHRLDTAVRAYQDLEARTQAGYEPADLEGLYQPISTEYRRLPGLHKALWAVFTGFDRRSSLEALRQRLMPRPSTDDTGQVHDGHQKLREDFYAALTAFGLCLQTALSSRGFAADPRFREGEVHTYKADLRFFTGLRVVVRQDALQAIDCGVYERQLRRLVDAQVLGSQVREPEGVFLVHELAQVQAPDAWSEEKTRNETDRIRTRLKNSIEQDLADDPYAQQVFTQRLQRAVAQAEAMFEHPLKQHALFKALEQAVGTRELPGVPDALREHTQARVCFGICRLVLGETAWRQTDEQALVQAALAMHEVVQQAQAEHSLNLQDMEAAIRQALLPRLFGLMGMDKASLVVERVLQVTRLGLARGGR